MPALRMHHRERGIVADGTDVAEVIGQPFEFRHQGAQPHGAFRNLALVRRLDRPGKGERVGDGAVAGNTPRQHRGPIDRQSRHQPFDALVHVTESRFEPHDGFAVRREPEVTRLDDARMHRAHRDLMQAFPADGKEGVGGRDRRSIPSVAGWPFRFHVPWSSHGRVSGSPSGSSPQRSRMARSRRMAGACVCPTDGNRFPSHSRLITPKIFMPGAGQRHVHVVTIGPEPEQSPIPGRQQPRRPSPGLGRHDGTRPRTMLLGNPPGLHDVAQVQSWPASHCSPSATIPRRAGTTTPMRVAGRFPRPTPVPDA